MDTQDISVAAGVVGVAVAALGLLLTWYRREEKEEHKSRDGRAQSPPPKRTRVRMFAAVAVGIIALATGGVVFTFKVGATGQGSPNPASFRSKSSGVSAALTATQYRGRLGQICSEAKERGRQIAESRPMRTALGLDITLEQDEVGAVKRLVPPNELAAANADMIAVWYRRISLLASIYGSLAQLSDKELASELREAGQLGSELAKIFRSLSVPECVM